MAPAVLSSSRSTLMHAALAHLSPELKTLDSIIRILSLPSSIHSPLQNVVLPTELLLMIRMNLLPIITHDLFEQSIVALQQYEASLKDLLCPDCLAYNHEIYGPDIWQWEQFTGACACEEGGDRVHSHMSTRSKNGVMPNPKQFENSQQWLEAHLSRKVFHIGGTYRLTVLPPKSHSESRSQPVIWEIVAKVLREYGCEICLDIQQRNRNGRMVPSRSSSYKTSPRTRDNNGRVNISVMAAALQRYQQAGIGQDGEEGHQLRARVIIERVNRDLGLSLEYTEVFEMPTAQVSSRRFGPREMCNDGRGITVDPELSAPHRSTPTKAPKFTTSIKTLQLLTSLTSLITAFLALPVTFVTLTLTIVCFYSMPTSLRIL